MPFTKVSVDHVYKKTERPAEKKDRRVRQAADEIFHDLFPASSCRGHHSQKRTPPSNNFIFLRRMQSCVSKNNLDSSPMPAWLGTKRAAKRMINKNRGEITSPLLRTMKLIAIFSTIPRTTGPICQRPDQQSGQNVRRPPQPSWHLPRQTAPLQRRLALPQERGGTRSKQLALVEQPPAAQVSYRQFRAFAR